MSRLRRLRAPAALLLALAVAGCGGDDADAVAVETYDQAGAPFRFSYPVELTKQAENTGREVKGRSPVHKVAVGRDQTNVVVVAVYRLKKPVDRFKPSDFQAVLDRAARSLAAAQKVKVERRGTGKLGDLPSTVYDLTASDQGVRQRLVYAFRGTSQFFVRCQWDPAGEDVVRRACAEVERSLEPA